MGIKEQTTWTTMKSGLTVPSGQNLQARIAQKDTFVQIKQMAIRVRELYSDLKIPLNPASELNIIINDVSKISDTWLKGESEPDRIGVLLRVSNAYRICSAIDSISSETGIATHLKKLASGDLNLFERKKSTAKDFLFEIELFIVFKNKGFLPKFEEPDISILLNNERIAVACKKIYSEKRLQNSLSEAVAQIQKSRRHGLVAINIDDLFPSQAVVHGLNIDDNLDKLGQFNTNFIKKHESRFREYMESSRIFACLVSSSLVGDSVNGETRINNHRQDTVWSIPKIGSDRQNLSDAFYQKIKDRVPA